MSSTEDRIAILLQQSRNSSSSSKRLEYLAKVKELVVDKEPDLLDNFLDEIIDHNEIDDNAAIRRFIVYFILEACKVDNEIIPRVIENLTNLLADDDINVAKDAIRAFGHVYRYAVIMIAGRPLDDTHESTWRDLNDLRDMVFSLVESDNEGMRSNIIKVFELTIITLSTSSKSSDFSKNSTYDNQFSIDRASENHKLLNPGKLKLKAASILHDLLTFAQNANMTFNNLVTILNSLIIIMRQRPQFNVRIINTIEWIHDTQLSKEKNGDKEVNPNKINWKFKNYQYESLRKCMKLHFLEPNLLAKPTSKPIRVSMIKILTGKFLDCARHEVDKYLPGKLTCDGLLSDNKKSKGGVVDVNAIVKKEATEISKGKDSDDDMVDDNLQEQIDKINAQPELLNIKPMTKEQQVEITRKVFNQTLTVEAATNIVIMSTGYLPTSMPQIFKEEYKAIGEITIAQQKDNLSYLLAKLVTADGKGAGAIQARAIQNQIEEIESIRKKYEKPGLVWVVFLRIVVFYSISNKKL